VNVTHGERQIGKTARRKCRRSRTRKWQLRGTGLYHEVEDRNAGKKRTLYRLRSDSGNHTKKKGKTVIIPGVKERLGSVTKKRMLTKKQRERESVSEREKGRWRRAGGDLVRGGTVTSDPEV
jgi:hypothetical protein